MDTQVKDMLGNVLAVGDTVVTDITTYKHTRLQAGMVLSVESGAVTIAYEKTQRYGSKKTRSLTVARSPSSVVKGARP